MTRKEYNLEILKYLSEHTKREDIENHLMYDDGLNVLNEIKVLIEHYPQQRFGQIICNYICPDYRDENQIPDSKWIMNNWFDISFDPFFEESKETYERLCK